MKIKPCLLVLMGPPLTGKSTLAAALASRSNLIVCDLDRTRVNKFGEIKKLPPEKEFDVLKKSYEENHNLANKYLKQGKPVIVAATYALPFSQELLKGFIKTLRVPVKIFLLHNPKREITRRLKERIIKGNLSAVRSMAKFHELKKHTNPFEEIEKIEIDTGKTIQENINQIFVFLSKSNLKKIKFK